MTEGQSANSPWAVTGAIEKLTTWWGEGLSTAEIGRRLGISKNSVISKARRIGLPGRPSPIIRDPSAPLVVRVERAWQPHAITLPKLPSITKEVAPVTKLTPRQLGSLGNRPAKPPEVEQTVLELPRISTKLRCQYPFGDPKAPDFRFCEKPVLVGSSYCAGCRKVCYQRVRLEEAA